MVSVGVVTRLLDRLAAAIAERLSKGPTAPLQLEEDARERSQQRSVLEPFVDAIEWEPLSVPLLVDVVRVGTTTGDFGKLSIRRRHDYRLAATLIASGTAPWTQPHMQTTPGSLNTGME